MPHPIYGRPSHSLEVISVKLYLPSPKNGHRSKLEAQGTCETQRGALWTYAERWTADEVERGLQPADAAHLVILSALQDVPGTQAAFNASMGSAGWEDVPLPY